MICRRLTITGRVQNVWYRDWLVEQARAIGVVGWVRNRADGSVEAVVSGPRETIDAVVAKARQGSPASHVADVVVEEVAAQAFEGFEKRATA